MTPVVDLAARTVTYRGRTARLTKKTSRIVDAYARRFGEYVDVQTIARETYGNYPPFYAHHSIHHLRRLVEGELASVGLAIKGIRGHACALVPVDALAEREAA